jgi:RHS repeat-associated protein
VKSRALYLTALAVAAVVVTQLAAEPAAVARPEKPASRYQKLKPQVERSVPGTSAPTAPGRPADPAAAAALKASPPAPVWPAGGSSTVDLSVVADPRVAARGPARAGALPVLVNRSSAALPGAVRVQVLDRAAATAAHQPVLLRIGRADGATGAAGVRVSLDYSGFRTAYGADWSTRLRLVQLPECALTTPDAAGCQPVPLVSVNNTAAMTVSADVVTPAVTAAPFVGRAETTAMQQTVLLAADSGPSGSAGDYTATKLEPSSNWQAGGSSGDFSWSYPVRVPPSLGGPTPGVSLSYSSQSVDGRMAASNNQPSWIGEGFDYQPGAVTRGYKACAEDMGGNANNSTKTGDICWATDNAMLSLSGHSGELVRDDGSGSWHLKNDDGTRVERFTGASNGDNNGEYWKITTTNGTQYFFGLNRLSGWVSGNPTTNSAWTVPVYGNNPGEPCNNSAGFSSSWCMQASQWNLDYVVDTHGNTMSYWYTPESNNYARNLTSSSVSTYTRGGYLGHIEYGTDNRSGTDSYYNAGHAPMSVRFGVNDRCVPNTTCDFAHPANWPDTPVDQNCSSSTSCTDYSPTFWTQKRLDTITTSVWNTATGSPKDVDRLTLKQTYPDPGDSTRAGLWLAAISRTGLVGGTASVPDVTFTGVQLPNRVDTVTDQSPPMNWWRMSYITTETGGIVGVTYTGQDCVAGSRMPASPASNTLRCYPAYWTRPGQQNPTIDWFHKYVVHQVTETDMAGGNPRTITTYDYPNPPAWHYTSDEGLIPASRKTWSQWRGYDKLVTTAGDPGSQTQTVTRYFRGMNGDHLPSGTRSVSIDGVADDEAYAGTVRESVTYNGPGGAEVSGALNTPWQSTPTASRAINGITVTARHASVSVVKTRTAIDGGRAPRTTTVTTTFDNTYGYPTQIADGGDDARTDDDRCSITTYANNTSAWIIGSPLRAQSYALACGQAPASDADVVSDGRTYYDNQPFGAAPTKGNVTQIDTVKAWNGPSNITWLTMGQVAYDGYGRVTDSWDVRGNHSTVAYTPASGGPVTSVRNTNALGWTTTSDTEPAWGTPTGGTDVNGLRTDATYDPLGRLTAVWLPNRSKARGDTPNRSYAYTIANNGVSSVATTVLGPTGGYLTSYQLYDSLLRPRQTQGPSATGTGRVLTDSFYDSAGHAVKANAKYYNADSGPGTALFTPQDNQVPSQNVTQYDGAGRPTAVILKSNGVEKWRTGTYYGGDHTDVTPPAGGTPASTWTDAQDQTVELRQYHGATVSGAYDATAYGYDRKGQLAQVTDVVGNHWTWTYDLRGRAAGKSDPDSGASLSTYNDAGDLLTKTDARGKTLAYSYDALGRRTGEYDTSTSGPKLAGWTFDTALLPDGVTPAKGQPATSTRYVGTNAYTSTIRGYTELYAQTGQTVVIPSLEGLLAGSYTITNTYTVDGSPNSVRLPASGGLGAETLTYTYNATTGFPSGLKTNYGGVSGTYVTDAQYTQFGEPTVTTFSTGGKLAQQGLYYEEATRRLKEAVTARETAPSTVADVNYTRDASGNITKIADTPAGGTADTQCFTNDYLRRLTQAWTPANGDCTAAPTVAGLGGPAPYWQSWTLDTIGNRRSQTDHAAAGDSTTTYTYPAAGAAQPHTVRSTSGATTGSYGYDQSGDTTSRPGAHGQQTLTWDVEGHLATVADSAGTSSSVYSPDGSRLVSHDPAGATLDIGDISLRYSTATNTVTATRYYTFNGGTVAQRTAAGVVWLASDHHGTDQLAVNASTQAVTQRRFKPYGDARGGTPTWVNDKGFVHGTADATGLTHLGAREYDPVTGRFISADAVVKPSDPQQINGYSYAGNNPVTSSDPTGLMHPKDDDGGAPLITPPGSTLVGTKDVSDTHYKNYSSDPHHPFYLPAGRDHWTIRYYQTKDGLLVGVSEGGCDDGGRPDVCAQRSWVAVYGPAAACTKGNKPGGLCYQGTDGFIHDTEGGKSCLPVNTQGPTMCSGGNQKPVTPQSRDCTPVPKPSRPLQFSPAQPEHSCAIAAGAQLPASCVVIHQSLEPDDPCEHATPECRLGQIFGGVSGAAGLIPGFICEACTMVSLIFGLLSAAYQFDQGQYKSAFLQAGSTVVGTTVGVKANGFVSNALSHPPPGVYRQPFVPQFFGDQAELFVGWPAGAWICDDEEQPICAFS